MRLINLLLIKIPVIGVIFAFLVTSNLWQSPGPFIPDSGPIVYWLRPIFVSLSYALGVALIALLFSDGLFINYSGDFAKLASRVALALSGISYSAAVLTLSQALSQPLSLIAQLNVVFLYGWDVTNVRALLLISSIALISFLFLIKPNLNRVAFFAIINIFALSLPSLLSHGGGLASHQLAVTTGLFHGLAAVSWISGLTAIFLIVSDKKNSKDQRLLALGKFSFLASISVVTLIVSGVLNAWTRFNNFSELLTSIYGQTLLIKIILMFLAIFIALKIRKNYSSNILKLVITELTLLLFVMGVAVALASTSYPNLGANAFTLIESLTGYPEPINFTWKYALTNLAIEPFTLTIGLIALFSYYFGVYKLFARGDSWPISRTLSWSLGILLGIYVTNSMLGRYAIFMFSAHMIVHMLLAMLVPMFLPLGAPVSLLLRALDSSNSSKNSVTYTRSLREWIVVIINSKFSYRVSSPIFTFLNFVAGTWILYLTPLLTILMQSHLGHLLMYAHFVITGYAFFWLIIGIDPSPRKIPDFARLALIFGAAGFHGIFGFLIYSFDNPIGGGWFYKIIPTWSLDHLADQKLGGGIAWATGELFSLLVLIIFIFQWIKKDKKLAKQVTDKEINDYNDYLKSIS